MGVVGCDVSVDRLAVDLGIGLLRGERVVERLRDIAFGAFFWMCSAAEVPSTASAIASILSRFVTSISTFPVSASPSSSRTSSTAA
jgi:hypothetical protein